MKPSRVYDIITQFVAAIFIFLFLTTAFDKLWHSRTFIYSMKQVPFLERHANLLAGLVPGIELAIAISLIIPATRRAGLIMATGLMMVFTIYLSTILLTLPDLPCSCGGIVKYLGWGEHLLLNLALAAVGLWSLSLYKRIIAINRSSRTPVT